MRSLMLVVLMLRSRCLTARPLSRRAFESLSLLTLCCQDSSIAERWESGEQISNSFVRQELAKHSA